MTYSSYENGDKSGESTFKLNQVVANTSSYSDDIRRLLGNMTNCTIGNKPVNVNPSIQIECNKVEEEFNHLVTGPVEPVRLLQFWPDHFATIIVLIT